MKTDDLIRKKNSTNSKKLKVKEISFQMQLVKQKKIQIHNRQNQINRSCFLVYYTNREGYSIRATVLTLTLQNLHSRARSTVRNKKKQGTRNKSTRIN